MSRIAKNPFAQSEISFDESTHRYTEIATGKNLISVSTLISKYCEPFDPHGFIIKKCAARDGISVEELRKKWNKKRDDACDTGTLFHSQAEEYFLNGKIPDGPDKDVLEKLYKNFQFKGKVYPEVLVYSIDFLIAGQSDIVEYFKKDNSIIIKDFKTNAELFKKSYKNLLYPLNHLPETKINKYALQLSTYAYLLEIKGYSVRADELCLFWITPKREIEKIPVPYLKNDVIMMIQHYTQGYEFF